MSKSTNFVTKLRNKERNISLNIIVVVLPKETWLLISMNVNLTLVLLKIDEY